jgi:hypothetical protein
VNDNYGIYTDCTQKYYGRDICYGYNEDTLTIYDVTNKKGVGAGSIISRTPYKGASYTHQGNRALTPALKEAFANYAPVHRLGNR